MEIQGKTALITGGAHRVGKDITLMLAQAGANVIVNYNSSADEALATVAEAEALGVAAMAVQCDVADRAAVERMVTAITERFRGVDIIVNSASYFGKTPFPSSDPTIYDRWEKVTRILIDGPFYICNMLVPTMLARGEGAIVNIIDLSVWHPWADFTAHAVGKSGLMALTRQLAFELSPTIRVNAVAPGMVLAPPNYNERRQTASAQRNLLRRWGSPADVTKAVKYLLEADFVTGEIVTVDGGERLGPPKSA
ncbi:MAG: SDR family oxidoreductase [Caldilineaceae bacterium]|nr:SDR family oxidoreductase [Caldilineaceae bacterium]